MIKSFASSEGPTSGVVDTGARQMKQIKRSSRLQDGFKGDCFSYPATTIIILITLVDLSRVKIKIDIVNFFLLSETFVAVQRLMGIVL
jgi:hypothetical protein